MPRSHRSIEKIRAADLLQGAAGFFADPDRVANMAVAGDVVRALAVRSRNEPAEMQRVARQGRVTGERRLARAVERSEKGALAGDRNEGRRGAWLRSLDRLGLGFDS